jgi:two-component system sensor histidine kinase KdpD
MLLMPLFGGYDRAMQHEPNESLPLQETDALSRALSGAISAIALLAGLSLALFPFRDQLNTGTIALVLLVPVLVSTIGGVWVALATAAVGAATFNYFFTTPYYSFRIESGESVAAFVVYVIVAAIVAIAASLRRQAVQLAGRRGQDEQFLVATMTDMASRADPEESILTGLNGVRTVAHLRGIRLLAENTWLGTVDEGYGDDTAAREVAELLIGDPSAPSTRAAGPVAVPIGAPDDPLGALGVDPGDRTLTADEYRMIQLFAGVLSLALRRQPANE